ncbi:hypothetical protein LTR08_000655 [Meristemomyces frigidus]|nr:hypothetical protein LTR08_000655 [Meristemomyces frigidus]
MDHTPDLDPAALARRQSTFSSSAYSTTSSSSPDFTNDFAITPDSENDGEPHLVPKIEELEDDATKDLEDAKSAAAVGHVTLPTPRKRGRPRKHPIVENKNKKASHPRSKTGCGTCRARKKKCDEGKPICMNCEKNNVVCDGYEPRQPWRGGKQRTVTMVQRSSIPAELPMLVDGIDGTVDQLFFHHFTAHVGKVLSLNDHQNPFLEIIVPMAMGHTGLMHSLLYLSGSCLLANEPNQSAIAEWEQRQEHHSSKAMRLLQQDLAEASDSRPDSVAIIGDPSIAQTLILCLQTVCAGDLAGSYRFHLNAMKEMLTQRQVSFPNEQLRQFILEFLLYHDYSSSITSLHNPLDQRSMTLMDNFRLPEFMIQPQAGTLLGVMDGLFGFISRIRMIRDQMRTQRASNQGHWWDAQIIDDALAIDKALRNWTCVHQPDSPRYTASLLYRQCTWVYLHRTIQLSKPSPTFKQAVDQGLEYLRVLSTDGSTQSILLMPLFLLGCAAFDPEQRPEISAAFQRLQEWSNLGNIKYARVIVEQIWEMMDQGQEEETWDWETIIANRGWDFLIT